MSRTASKYCDDLKKLTYIEKCFEKLDILYKFSVFAAEITFTNNEEIYNEEIIMIMIHEVNFVKNLNPYITKFLRARLVSSKNATSSVTS